MGKIYRDWFTNEVTEKPYELENGRAIIARIEPEGLVKKTYSTAYSTPLKLRSISVIPAQAREMNEQVKRAGIRGVEYCERTGDCYVTSEGSRRAEARRRDRYAN